MSEPRKRRDDEPPATDKRKTTCLTPEDLAVIKENAARWAAKIDDMPDHMRLAIARIWNSVE